MRTGTTHDKLSMLLDGYRKFDGRANKGHDIATCLCILTAGETVANVVRWLQKIRWKGE